MSGQVTQRLRPEEQEVALKRAELVTVLAALADGELELTDLRSELAAFEGRYLRQVATLYAELDEWNARISEFKVQRHPSPAAQQEAEEAREKARESHGAAHGEASEVAEFAPSPELKRLYREAAKLIHPDLATDRLDQERRTRFMAEVNRAYRAVDGETLRRILDEFRDSVDAILDDGIGAELIRIIRQISLARERIAAIEQEVAELLRSEIAQLKQDVEKAQQNGRDLLAELANNIRKQILRMQKEYEVYVKKGSTL